MNVSVIAVTAHFSNTKRLVSEMLQEGVVSNRSSNNIRRDKPKISCIMSRYLSAIGDRVQFNDVD